MRAQTQKLYCYVMDDGKTSLSIIHGYVKHLALTLV